MEKFYIGADIGTNSVGIACTDENYNLLRIKGKDCWTVRLFDECKTAEERRGFRTSRRRTARRKQRINFLQSLFAPYMNDKTFFIRLNNSQFLPEDKSELLHGDKNTLFSDDYDDKKFHAEFPTIYHLRDKLMSGGIYDLRLYYLALHHIIKYRGHFLFEGSMEDVRDLGKLLNALNDAMVGVYGDELSLFDKSVAEKAKSVLLDDKLKIRDKQIGLEKVFRVDDKIRKEIIKGLCGGKISPSILFGDEYKDEKNFSFKEISDEIFESMRDTYGDDFGLLCAIRSVYGFVTFEKLLEGHSSLSAAMIAVYEKHKNDLKRLKSFIKSERPEDYNKIFKSTEEKCNYVNYVGYTKKGGDKKKVKKCKDDEFYAYLKKYLSGLDDVKDAETRNAIIEEIEDGKFLPKILHSDNGLFPRQINESELNKIVGNMVKAYPETAAVEEKILTLFRFRIPYYVGPLSGENSWAVRKSDDKITPWNFYDVIDAAKSNEEFMRRMTNKCAYLQGEDVLPKASVLYQKFDTLNQLNKLRVNDEIISVELKKKIYNELFLVYPKVSDKKIKELLVREGRISPSDVNDTVLSGKDGEFKASMSSYIRLKKILGDFVDKDLSENGGVIENIILWHTLNTDKSIVENLIKSNYGKIPEIKNALPQLKGLTFNDFGRLSAKLLSGIYTIIAETGELRNIIDTLYETNENLNEILNDERYEFGRIINEENGQADEEVTYETVKKLYVSPAVRRGIWQAMSVTDEYVRAIGRAPDKIFIEVTRTDGKKGDAGRTQPRKRRLQEKFKALCNDGAFDDIIAELDDEKYTDMRLRQERLYLYFRQLGRCMYTGQRISLDDINDTNLYDVDHILPRTFIKDDSLDNKVLVLRSKNAQKSDTYPLPAGFSDQRGFWKLLLDKGLIEKVTYDRLTRTEPLREDEYRDFINRQKVITDQTVKAVAELMRRKYPTAKIVYSKAKNVSDFRKKFKLFKCRETNDLHHARDAYLNVVVGNVYDTVFSTPMAMFRKDGDVWRNYNLKKLFTREVKFAWNESSIAIVKKTYARPSMTVTRYAMCAKGGFYDQTIYGKGERGITAPRKANGPLSDMSKYGGYKSQSTAYFAIVSSTDKKGNKIKTIEAVPVLTAYQAKTDNKAVEKYFADRLSTPEIIVPKLKIKQLISFNGTPCYLAGITGTRIIAHSAVQLFTDNKTDDYVNSLLNLEDMKSKKAVNVGDDKFVMKTDHTGAEKLVIDKATNIALYRDLMRRLGLKIYSGISAFATFAKNMENGEDKFISLTVCDQATVLLQILKFFKCNAEISDITLIGGSGKSGTVLLNKNITDVDFEIINLSPAGLIERVRRV